jgi:hypothetical protein
MIAVKWLAAILGPIMVTVVPVFLLTMHVLAYNSPSLPLLLAIPSIVLGIASLIFAGWRSIAGLAILLWLLGALFLIAGPRLDANATPALITWGFAIAFSILYFLIRILQTLHQRIPSRPIEAPLRSSTASFKLDHL